MKKNTGIIVIVIVSVIIFLLQFQYKKTYQPHTYYQVYLDDKVIGTIEDKKTLEEYINKQGSLVKKQITEYKEQLEILEGIDSIIFKKLNNNSEKSTYLEMKKAYDDFFELVDENGSFEEKDKEKVEKDLETLQIYDAFFSRDSIRNYSEVEEQIEKSLLTIKDSIISNIEERKESLSLSETEKYYLESYASKNMNEISYAKQANMKKYVTDNAAYEYTDNIYSPLGLKVEKVSTYYASLSPVDDVYKKIIKEKPCAVEAYQFRIKSSNEQKLPIMTSTGALLLEGNDYLFSEQTDDVIVYVTEEKIFKDAVEKLETVFVGTENYEKYKNNTQEEIKDTGSKIKDVYVAEDITVKKVNISVGENIYNDADKLSSFLLYGENKTDKTVYATVEDTVLSIANKNGVSIEEIFLANPTITSVNNIFYQNQPITITQTNPKLSIVVEQYTVEDKKVDYKREERYDSKINMNVEEVIQKGKSGEQRVAQNVRTINGQISFVDPVSNVTIKQVQNEIVLIGTKEVPSIGSLKSWYWPTNSGYVLSSYYGWRKYPFGNRSEFHAGLDIAGTGYGSPVYASNNGTIISIKSEKWNYGNSIMIDHGNGYYSLYGHMSRFQRGLKEGTVVARGQVIGYVGATGAATGPHLHFEIRNCKKYSCVLDPLPFLRK